jgi:predicted  nucleic acid-binding Zn ribbon protein
LRYWCSEIEYNNGMCLECGGHYEFCNGSHGLLYYECDSCNNVISKLDD